jgi:hypothetical protein
MLPISGRSFMSLVPISARSRGHFCPLAELVAKTVCESFSSPLMEIETSSSQVFHHVRIPLGSLVMKCEHLGSVPHELDEAQKATRVQCAHEMIQVLDRPDGLPVPVDIRRVVDDECSNSLENMGSGSGAR